VHDGASRNAGAESVRPIRSRRAPASRAKIASVSSKERLAHAGREAPEALAGGGRDKAMMENHVQTIGNIRAVSRLP